MASNETSTNNSKLTDIKSPVHDGKEKLYVIAVISNSKEYKRRYELALKFIDHITTFNIELTVVECQLGQRPFHIPISETSKYKVIRVRNNSELWLKENLINIGINSLPSEAKYVAWIDADLEFENANWVEQTIESLKHNHFVQLFRTCSDLGPDRSVLALDHSLVYFVYNYEKIDRSINGWPYQPGYAWAGRIDTIREMGGLFEYAICGGGDRQLACSFFGQEFFSMPSNIGKTYSDKVFSWASKVRKVSQTKVGYVEGNILHNWHGKKENRKYSERWEILVSNDIDIDKHITKNDQGVLEWSEFAPLKLKNEISEYFSQRNEDDNNV